MEKTLVIVRGVPGSGKSTFASLITSFVCTADDHFMKGGKYMFDRNQLGAAHKACIDKCEWGMHTALPVIAVANTSVHAKDLKPYIDLANKYGYKVISTIVENRHG